MEDPLLFVLSVLAIVFALGVVPFGASRLRLHLLGFVGMLVAVALRWTGAGAALGRAAAGARAWCRARRGGGGRRLRAERPAAALRAKRRRS
jgi:hypothetical protein